MFHKKPHHLKKEHRFILACLRFNKTKADFDEISALANEGLDWESLYKTASSNGIRPILYKFFKNNDLREIIPTDFYQKLKETYYYNLARNTKLFEALKEILHEFNKNNIDVILLKGAYLAPFVYKDIGLREMSDLDLLVRKEQLHEAVDIVKSLGYTQPPFMSKWHERHHFEMNKHWPVLNKGGKKVDLHWVINYSETKEELAKEIWENAAIRKFENTFIYGLPEKIFVLYVLNHLLSHEEKSQYFLRSYYDLALFIRAFDKTVRLEELIYLNDIHFFIPAFEYHFEFVKSIFDSEKHRKINENANFRKDIIQVFENSGAQSRTIKAHIRNLKQLEYFHDKLFYAFYSLFPSKEYMQYRYPLPVEKDFFYIRYFHRYFSFLLRFMKKLKSPKLYFTII